MFSIRRAICAAIIFLSSNAILFGALKLIAYAEDMVVDDFIKYLLLVILPIGYILFITEGDNAFSKVCKTAGFLLVVVSTLVLHLGIPDDPNAFYLTYMILPISWWTLAVLFIHEYKGNDIQIDGWKILCSIVTLMIVLVVTQYIIFETPNTEEIKKAVNTYLIVGGIALAAIGIVILKIRNYKKYRERSSRPGAQLAPHPLAFDKRYYCYDCQHCDFLIDNRGITRYYCKLSNTEVTRGQRQCSDKFKRSW